MKAIPIVPIPHLEELSGGRPRYLALSHLLESSVYARFLKTESDRGAFITLDNSAHELGKGQRLQVLVEQAREIGAREIVLPDELFSFGGTISRTREAFIELCKFPELAEGLQFMIVPQGKNVRSVRECLSRLVREARILPKEIRSTLSIGVSKDYHNVKTSRSFLDLLSFASRQVREVHLLGWPLPLTSLRIFATPQLALRSTDSARAITYAMFGIRLSDHAGKHLYEYPKRPKDFFVREMTPKQLTLAKENLEYYYSLARVLQPVKIGE